MVDVSFDWDYKAKPYDGYVVTGRTVSASGKVLERERFIPRMRLEDSPVPDTLTGLTEYFMRRELQEAAEKADGTC